MRVIAALSTAAGLTLLLAGCSAGQSASPVTVQTISSAPGTCDQAAITEAIQDAYDARAQSESTGLALKSVDSVRCSNDWAVAQVVIGDDAGHDLSDHEVAQLSAGRWAVMDRMLVCGTWNPRKQDAVPADSLVPELLYAAACTTD